MKTKYLFLIMNYNITVPVYGEKAKTRNRLTESIMSHSNRCCKKKKKKRKSEDVIGEMGGGPLAGWPGRATLRGDL